MIYFHWNEDKNTLLKKTRGISFEEIEYLIDSNQILGIFESSTRKNQKIYVLNKDNYAIVVPFVEINDVIFFKTAFPSRKYSKIFGLKR